MKKQGGEAGEEYRYLRGCGWGIDTVASITASLILFSGTSLMCKSQLPHLQSADSVTCSHHGVIAETK